MSVCIGDCAWDAETRVLNSKELSLPCPQMDMQSYYNDHDIVPYAKVKRQLTGNCLCSHPPASPRHAWKDPTRAARTRRKADRQVASLCKSKRAHIGQRRSTGKPHAPAHLGTVTTWCSGSNLKWVRSAAADAVDASFKGRSITTQISLTARWRSAVTGMGASQREKRSLKDFWLPCRSTKLQGGRVRPHISSDSRWLHRKKHMYPLGQASVICLHKLSTETSDAFAHHTQASFQCSVVFIQEDQ